MNKEPLSSLQEEFMYHFHYFDTNENVHLELACSLFRCTGKDRPSDIKEELLELIITVVKEELKKQQSSISSCLAKMLSTFPNTSEFALKFSLLSHQSTL